MNNINIILEKKLCSGCGACTIACKKNCITMKYGSSYNFPVVDGAICSNCGLCLGTCPGNRIFERLVSGNMLSLNRQNVLNACTACSNDGKIRYDAASGGVISSLAIFMLQQKYIDGVICVKQDDDNPLANKSFIAVSELEILQALGSRYSPVSNCEALKGILYDNKVYAFIGKPCEIEAVNGLQKYLPELKGKIKYKISIMCACTPSRKGTLKLLEDLKIDPANIKKLSYRGKGWPGYFQVETKDGGRVDIPYLNAWNNCLSKYSCLRCVVCDDPLGSSSDITVGDAWDQELLKNNIGLSAVIVRTQAGRELMDMAVGNNVIAVQEAAMDDIYKFQKSLINKINKADGNIYAFNLVFRRRIDFSRVQSVCGFNLKAYYSLSKRVIRFLKLKYQC